MKSTEYVSPPDSFGIYPERPRVTRSAELEGVFRDAFLDPFRDLLYLALPGEHALAVLPLQDPASLMRVELDGRPTSLDLSPDGSTLVVALTGRRALALLDPADLYAPPSIVPLTGQLADYRPVALRYGAGGTVMALVMDPAYYVRFMEFDPASGAQRVRSDLMTYGAHGAAVRPPDYSRIAFNLHEHCGIVYEVATDRFGSCQPVEYEGHFSVSADGSRFAKGYGIHGTMLEPIQTVPFGAFATHTTGISRDGSELFIAEQKGVTRFRIEGTRALERTPLPPIYFGALLFAREGRLLVAIGQEPEYAATSTRVYVVDLD